MVNVPVESVTDLKTCSTEIIEGLVPSTSTLLEETTGSDMSTFTINWKLSHGDFTKLAGALWAKLAKPLSGLLAAALLALAAPAGAQGADTVLIVGDSLSAEYGLKRGTGWVPLLEKQIVRCCYGR